MKHSTRPVVTVTMGEPQKEPPTPQRQGYYEADHWHFVAQGAKANPGMWCPFKLDGLTTATLHAASATKIKRGLIKAFKDGQFEARRQGDVIWVRYNGPAIEPVAEWELISQ